MTRNQLRMLCAPANAALPIAILLAAPVAAQTPPGSQPASAKLEEVVVTGSLVRREDIITPSPVTVISAQDIQNSGMTTVADVVRAISADNSGTIPTAFGLGFAAGSSGVALRGLTVNSTLVLVDGRRTANYALADDGQRTFVDLNTLPLNAVERIEVLKDGASSLYGADAIAGVVNIILRKSYQGAEFAADAGTSSHTGGSSWRLSGTLGKGDLSADRFNAYVDFEYQNDARILTGARDFPFNTLDLSSIGGLNLGAGQPGLFSGSTFGSVAPATLGTPGDLTTGTATGVTQPLRACGAGTTRATDSSGNVYCAQNLLTSAFDDQPAEERAGVLTRFSLALTDAAQAYLTASFYQDTVTIDNTPRQIQAGTPHNTNAIALPPTLPGGALNPNDPFAATGQYALVNYAFGDIPNVLTERNRVERFVAGVRGAAGGWDYDSALVISHTSLNTLQRGELSFSGLLSAVTNGTYNFVNPSANSAAVRNLVAPPLAKTSTTDMDSLDLRITRALFRLPGGEALQLGLGAEARYEAQFDPDLNASGDVQGLGVAQTEGSRTVYAAYAELDAPIVKALELDLSARYDHYGDFGGKFVPKAGFKFTPLKQLTLRGTYSQGFRAPSFAENGSSSAGGFITYTLPTAYVNAHNGDGYVQPYTQESLSVANPDIKAETSDSYTFGVILTPVERVSLTADYYYIKKRNVISVADPTAAIAAYFAGAPLPVGFTITPDIPDPAFPNLIPRPLVVGAPYVNANSLSTDGVDVDVRVNFDLAPHLRYTTELEATKIFSWKVVFPDGSAQQYVGTQGPYVLSSGAGTPRYRGRWTNAFDIGQATVSANVYYVSGIYMYTPDITPAGFCFSTDAAGNPFPANCRVASFVDVDLTGAYRLGEHLQISAAVENALDRKPPFDPIDYAATNYNPTYAQSGIVGRFFRLAMSYKF